MSPDPPRLRATLVVSRDAFTGATVRVEGDRYRHLFRSKRLAMGESVRVVDGLGSARVGRIGDVTRREAVLELGGELEGLDPAVLVTLIVAPPKPERASWLVEKATELGVAKVCWLRSKRAPRDLTEAALARHRRVAVAALEQCGGARLPEISGLHEWSQLGELVASAGSAYALDPAAKRSTFGLESPVGFVVGPEGGWDPEEARELLETGVEGLNLGPRVLRVETAAVAAATLALQHPS